MNKEEKITPEVKQLLDDLATPHANLRRQQQMGELIDNLASQEQSATSTHRLILHPWRWAGIAAAAACLALFFIRMPLNNAPIATSETVATIEHPTFTPTITNDTAETHPITSVRQSSYRKPTLIAQATTAPTTDETSSTTSNDTAITIITTVETATPTPTANQVTPSVALPTRRVVACNNLVCYDCEPTRNRKKRKQATDKTIFGTPASPNIDEGILMLASL